MTLQAISPPKRVGCEKMNTDLAKKKSLTLSHQGSFLLTLLDYSPHQTQSR
jgi:hypothetical protein